MTTGARPNLGGLFNGSTPPDRSSRVAGALGPRLLAPAPVTGRNEDSTAAESADAQPDGAGQRSALGWIDPVRAVELYFEFLQSVLNANRDLAVGWATAIRSVPQRAGLRR